MLELSSLHKMRSGLPASVRRQTTDALSGRVQLQQRTVGPPTRGHLLVSAIACSARTRTRVSLRFPRLSPSLSAWFLRFFSVADAPALAAYSLETQDRCGACCLAGSGSRHDRQ